MTAQNGVNSRNRRSFETKILKTSPDLARSPRRMCRAHLKHAGFNLGRTAQWALVRTARPVLESAIALFPALQPLVPNIRADPKTPAQLPDIRHLHSGQTNELATLFHDRHLSPWHGPPPAKPNPCENVSAMSPNTCQPCSRSIHGERAMTILFLFPLRGSASPCDSSVSKSAWNFLKFPQNF